MAALRMSYTPRTEPDHNETGFPKGVPYIIGNEGAERFSFYGMKAILYTYIAGLLSQYGGLDPATADSEATQYKHLFVAGVYFMALIGGVLADRWWGKYKTIMILSVVYTIGHAALAAFESPHLQEAIFGRAFINPVQGLGIGLLLICVGSGGIKPCVSAHVGDQFGKKNWHLVQKIFNAFYFIINFGSFFSTIMIPQIRGDEILNAEGAITGYTGSVTWAFALPGILMGIATIAFYMGRRVFIHVPASPGGKLGALDFFAGFFLASVVGVPIYFSKLLGLPGWQIFLISLACFAVFVVLFTLRQNQKADDGFLAIMFYLLSGAKKEPLASFNDAEREDPFELRQSSFWKRAVDRFGLEAAEGPRAVLNIMSVFAFVCVFWALFDQHSSTWVKQAKELHKVILLGTNTWIILGLAFGAFCGGAFYLVFREGKRPLANGLLIISTLAGTLAGWSIAGVQPADGFHIIAEQVSAVNPIMVMLFIPYVIFGLYPLLAKIGFEPKPLRRMTLGMFVAGLSFVASALIQHGIDASPDAPPHVAWQLIPYAVLTLSEVMVSVTGLEFAYTQAPKRMKSVVMSFWMFNVTIGSLLVVFLAGFKDLPKAYFFWVFAGLMALAALAFGWRAKSYRYVDYTQ